MSLFVTNAISWRDSFDLIFSMSMVGKSESEESREIMKKKERKKERRAKKKERKKTKER